MRAAGGAARRRRPPRRRAGAGPLVLRRSSRLTSDSRSRAELDGGLELGAEARAARRPGPSRSSSAGSPPSARCRRPAGTRPPLPRRVEALAVVREEELDEPLGVVLSDPSCEQPAPATLTSAPGSRAEEVVRDRCVRLLFLDEVEVVVVDEPEVDLAGGDRLDDRRVLLVLLGTVRLHRLAATGASCRRPARGASRSRRPGRTRSSVRSRRALPSGSVSSNTEAAARPRTPRRCCRRSRARDPTCRPSGPRRRGNGRRRGRARPGGARRAGVDRAERPRVLREEHVRRRVVALLGDRRRELGAVAVANVDLDSRLLRTRAKSGRTSSSSNTRTKRQRRFPDRRRSTWCSSSRSSSRRSRWFWSRRGADRAAGAGPQRRAARPVPHAP